MLTTKSATDIGKAETDISLLDDEHKDAIIRVYGPSGESLTWHVFVLADMGFLVPIQRTGDLLTDKFMFDGEARDGCVRKNVHFFRKLTDGKVVAFYAIQTTLTEDLSGTKLVYEVFRFGRGDSDSIVDNPRFHKVAERSTIVRSCKVSDIPADVIKLIHKN